MPRSAGSPCPVEERLRQAGLLAHGSMPFRPPSQKLAPPMAKWPHGSPLTVAGAARGFHPSSLLIPSRGTCRSSAPIAARSAAQDERRLREPAKFHSRAGARGARKGLIGKPGLRPIGRGSRHCARNCNRGCAPPKRHWSLTAYREGGGRREDPGSQETGPSPSILRAGGMYRADEGHASRGGGSFA